MTNIKQGHIFEGWYRRFTTIALGLISGMIFVEAAFADISNTATTTAEYSGSTYVSSPSTQSIAVAPAAPAITLIKTGTLDTGDDSVANPGDVITYAFTVANVGNVTLSAVTVNDLGPDVVMSEIAGNLPLSLAPGESDSTTFTGSYTLTQADIDSGSFSNDASATGDKPLGGSISGLSDDPADTTDVDGDGDGHPDDTTVVALPAAPAIEVTLEVESLSAVNGVSESFTDAGDTISYTIVVTNTGNVTISSLTPSSLTGLITTTCVPDTLAPGATATCEVTDHLITDSDIDAGLVTHAVTISGTSPAGGDDVVDLSDDPADNTDFDSEGDGEPDDPTTVLLAASPALESIVEATKTVDQPAAIYGEEVTFTLQFENQTGLALSNLTLTDQLPEGLLYIPDTSTVDGVESEPVQTGQILRWSGVSLSPDATIEVELSATVLGNLAGEALVNRTWVEDLGGAFLSNVATVIIQITPEHVFDCTDIIGKVFDDDNYNGYQNTGEPGLSGVVVSTLNGWNITVDEYGRFSVPCADLPRDIGSNFAMKLDDRTLPQGYRVGTENPRVVRVTAGKLTRLNFGAVIANIVRVDLSSDAFVANTDKLTEALQIGFDQIFERFSDNPLTVKIGYLVGDNNPAIVQQHLQSLETELQRRWSKSSEHKLNLLITLVREQ